MKQLHLLFSFCLAIMAILWLPLPGAFAQQVFTNNFVIGYGLGDYAFDEADDLRKGKGPDEDGEIKSGLYEQVYFDLFFTDSFALGYNLSNITATRYVKHTDGSKYKEQWEIVQNIVTVKYILFGVGTYFSLVANLGYGVSKYSYNMTFDYHTANFCSEIGCDNIDASTEGNMTVFGIYLDMGEDGIGFRLGYQVHSVDYEELQADGGQKVADVSANGNVAYLDFRYAW